MNKIELLFKNRGIPQPGGWFIYTKQDAIEFIEECKKQAVLVLGIDGFFRGKDISHQSIPNLSVTPDSIQPSMEHSVDFSSSDYVSKAGDIYVDAEMFLKNMPDRMYFEIVCEE